MKKKLSARPIYVDIAKAIDYYNTNSKDRMTVQILADKIGVSKQTLFNYKRGVKSADVDILERISIATGLAICLFVPINFTK